MIIMTRLQKLGFIHNDVVSYSCELMYCAEAPECELLVCGRFSLTVVKMGRLVNS